MVVVVLVVVDVVVLVVVVGAAVVVVEVVVVDGLVVVVELEEVVVVAAVVGGAKVVVVVSSSAAEAVASWLRVPAAETASPVSAVSLPQAASSSTIANASVTKRRWGAWQIIGGDRTGATGQRTAIRLPADRKLC